MTVCLSRESEERWGESEVAYRAFYSSLTPGSCHTQLLCLNARVLQLKKNMLSTSDLIIRNSLFTYNAVAVEELIANKAKSGLRDLDSENSRVTKILLNFQNSNKKTPPERRMDAAPRRTNLMESKTPQ